MDVLSTIQDAQLYINWSKSEILIKEITYLGHLITPDGIKPLNEKVKSIQKWDVPEHIYQIRSFIGAVSYYRRFIHNFAHWAKPLTDLTKDDDSRPKVQAKMVTMAKWGRTTSTRALRPGEWTDECQKSFDHLRTSLISEPVLKLPNQDLAYEMFTDASKVAVGAVLMQRYGEELHPVAYYSQKLTSTEINYPVHELELLAIFKSLKHRRHYLINQECLIYTDHKPLTFLLTQETLSPRQQRWITFLSDFKVDIIAIPGAKNVVADALSRYPYHHIKALTESAETIKAQLPKVRNDQASLNMSWVYAMSGFDEVSSYVPYQLGQDPARMTEYYNMQDGDFSKLVDVRDSLIKAYPLDPFASSIIANSKLQGYVPYRYLYEDEMIFYLDSNHHKLLYVPECAQAPPKYQVTEFPVAGDEQRVSVTLREELIREAHELSGHLGYIKTYFSLRKFYYWPRMHKHCNDFVRSCPLCQANKTSTMPKLGHSKSTEIPDGRWETVSMDWITGLPETASGFDSILVIIDFVSKRAHFIPTHDNSTSADTANIFFNEIFRHHGLPLKIISDRDRRFTSGFWKTLTRILGTHLAMSTPYHPQTDGATEALNKTLAAMLRSYTGNNYYDWDKYLIAAEFAYNNSVHSTTAHTPFELDTGRNPIDALSKSYLESIKRNVESASFKFDAQATDLFKLWQDKMSTAKANLEDSQHYMRERYDKDHVQGSFSTG